MFVYFGLLLVYKSRFLGCLVVVVICGKEVFLFNLGFINIKSNLLFNFGSGLLVYYINLFFLFKSVFYLF